MKSSLCDFFPVSRIRILLARRFRLEQTPAEEGEIVFFDTWIRTLGTKGRIGLMTAALTCIQDWEDVFPCDLSGPVAATTERLAVMNGERDSAPWKYVSFGTWRVRQTPFYIVNDDGKRIVKGCFLRMRERKAGARTSELVLYRPFLGYEKDVIPFMEYLERHCGLLRPGFSRIAPNAPRPDFPAFPRDKKRFRADFAAMLQAAVSYYFSLAIFHVPGILSDLDQECLHQYRITLRRARSLLSLFARHCGPGIREARDALAGLMRRTNRLRDLDVYLASGEAYRKLAPATEPAALDSFFATLARHRADEMRELRAFLRSTEYKRISRSLSRLFQPHAPLWAGNLPRCGSTSFLGKRIKKTMSTIETARRELDHAAPDAAIHRVRIMYKKARYLLEFSRDFLRHQASRSLLEGLKTVQTELGQFNDWAIQWGHLAAEPDSAAVGAILAAIAERRDAARARALALLLPEPVRNGEADA